VCTCYITLPSAKHCYDAKYDDYGTSHPCQEHKQHEPNVVRNNNRRRHGDGRGYFGKVGGTKPTKGSKKSCQVSYRSEKISNSYGRTKPTTRGTGTSPT
jgi:hypothetical protein